MICRKDNLSLLVLLLAGPASAAERVVAADLGAMGGTAVATSDRNAAITVNPGLIGLHERYDLHAQFRYGPDAGSHWAASAVDTRTSKWLNLGLMYAGDRAEPELLPRDLPGWTVVGTTPPNIRRHHDITLAAGLEGWDRRFSVGLSGTLSIYSYDQGGAGSSGNVDLGVGARPTDWLDLGLVGRNLVPVDDIGRLVFAIAGGARLHGEPGALSVDLEWRDEPGNSPFVVGSGGELPLGEVTLVRVGHRYEGPQNQHKMTGGVGFGSSSGSLDLAVQVPVGPNQPTLNGLAGFVSINLAAPSVDEPVGW